MNYIHADVHRCTILDDSELSDASAAGFGSCSRQDRRFSLILTSSVLAVPEFGVRRKFVL
eukprot:COSAG02_NODE_6053_length_3840_cov_2.507618_1_plen_59_part_10